jgi:hypothetical protein
LTNASSVKFNRCFITESYKQFLNFLFEDIYKIKSSDLTTLSSIPIYAQPSVVIQVDSCKIWGFHAGDYEE